MATEGSRAAKGKPRLKEIFDEHLHRPGFEPAWLEVEVEDREAGGGVRALGGGEIAGASRGFIELADGGRLPYHRVLRVRSRGTTLYERGRGGAKAASARRP